MHPSDNEILNAIRAHRDALDSAAHDKIMGKRGILDGNVYYDRTPQKKEIIDSKYTKWAYEIAEHPHSVPTTSVEKAIGAFINWGVDVPENLMKFALDRGLDRFIPELKELKK